jgi:hypothetical protein
MTNATLVDLPDETLNLIIPQVSLRTVLNLRTVCKHLHHVCSTDEFWHDLFQAHFGYAERDPVLEHYSWFKYYAAST